MTRPARTCAAPHCGREFTNPVYRRNAASYPRRGHCGYCPPCYRRWADHGYPPQGPPSPQRSGRKPGPVAGRVEDYAEFRALGLSRAEAALRLGITRRTIQRYETALRSGEAQAA